ncbi:MAG: ADP-ribosylglycohydrolase family protein [Muribaculaceae bacterium]|nr:ADP-ribosylglycohydrolase family protein [Muribaculaceae bacterium]
MAEFSDDTQMSLFTAEGLLSAISEGNSGIRDIGSSIRAAYKNWYTTQTRVPDPMDNSWLTHISPLWSQRAPGMTCMSALHKISYGDVSAVSNDFKGCGGVMRVAPIGIFAAAHPTILDLENAGNLAGYAAEITHKHPLSSYSSMALAMLITEIITNEEIDRDRLRYVIIDRVFKPLGVRYPKDNDLANLFNLILIAMALAYLKRNDSECIAELGQGWVAEETLAIAIFSVIRYILITLRSVSHALSIIVATSILPEPWLEI